MSGNEISNTLNRRQFLAYSAAGAAGLLLPTRMVEAGTIDDGLKLAYKLTKLHPVRFVAGVLFDLTKAVVVDFVKDEVVAWLKEGKRSEARSVDLGSTAGTESANEFRHVNYKASNVVLGTADYKVDKERQLRLQLTEAEQKERLKILLDYMRREGVHDFRIKLVDMSGPSKPISALPTLTADDLFTMEYLQIDRNKERHYSKLMERTGTKAFEHWSV